MKLSHCERPWSSFITFAIVNCDLNPLEVRKCYCFRDTNKPGRTKSIFPNLNCQSGTMIHIRKHHRTEKIKCANQQKRKQTFLLVCAYCDLPSIVLQGKCTCTGNMGSEDLINTKRNMESLINFPSANLEQASCIGGKLRSYDGSFISPGLYNQTTQNISPQLTN